MNTPIDDNIKAGTFHRLYLIYGEESYLKTQYKKKLLKALVPPDDTMNFNRFEGDKTDVNEIISLADTLPFFSERRVILCERTGFFKRAEETLAAYFPNIPESTVMIFVEDEKDARSKTFKEAGKAGLAVEMTLPDERTLAAWISARVKNAGKKMKQDAWEEFLYRNRPEKKQKKDASGDTMLKMDREIEKLLAYCHDKEIIERSDVEEICTGQLESRIFDMIDGIAEKDSRRVMAIYHDLLLQKTPPLQILALIERQFRQMLLIREMSRDRIDARSIASRTGTPDFVVRKTLSRARAFSEELMKSLLSDAAQTERDMKSGLIEHQTGVEILMLRYAR